MQNEVEADPFLNAFGGVFKGILKWEQLDVFWGTLRAKADKGWYVYAIGAAVPTETRTAEELRVFIDELDALLRSEHTERYCGIVYVDDVEDPTFVKVFDPNNLGTGCSCSDKPRLPGWVLSQLKPADLDAPAPQTVVRRHWWQRIFGGQAESNA